MNDLPSTFSNYPKISETSMPVDEVEAWLDEFEHKRAENKPNGGIIRSTPTVIFVDGMGNKLTKRERKAALKQSQKEFKEAMRALRIQEEEDRKAIAKKIKEWSLESDAPPAPRQKSNKVIARRKDLIKLLNEGGSVSIPKNQGETEGEYQTLRRDIRSLRNSLDGEVIRIKEVGQSDAFWKIDNFETYDEELDYRSSECIKKALLTGKAVRITPSLYQEEKKALASIMQRMPQKGVKVSGIYSLNNSIKGWVVA